jgi:hypothetical protein
MSSFSFTINDLNELNHMNNTRFDSKCKICNETSPNIVFHLKLMHGKDKNVDGDLKVFYEPGCVCKVCNEDFSFKRQLLDHMTTHVPKVYCYCGRELQIIRYSDDYGYPDICWDCRVFH